MSFTLPQGARTFFKTLPEGREGAAKVIRFDYYYCCLLAGLDARKIGSEAELEDAPFLTSGYPEDYRAQADLVAGLLVDAELERKGIKPEDKASIEREMVGLLEPTAPTRLSPEGNKLLNQYAAHGFKLIEAGMMPPANLEEFLVAYHDQWHQDDEISP